MTSRSLVPCLWFDDQAELAAEFTQESFRRAHYRDVALSESTDNPSGKPRGSVLTVEFDVAGQRFTALNGGPHFVVNPSISFFVRVDSPSEAIALFCTR